MNADMFWNSCLYTSCQTSFGIVSRHLNGSGSFLHQKICHIKGVFHQSGKQSFNMHVTMHGFQVALYCWGLSSILLKEEYVGIYCKRKQVHLVWLATWLKSYNLEYVWLIWSVLSDDILGLWNHVYRTKWHHKQHRVTRKCSESY